MNWQHSGVWGAPFQEQLERGEYDYSGEMARKQHKRWKYMKEMLQMDPNEIEDSPLYGYHAEVDRSYDRIPPGQVSLFTCVFGTVRIFILIIPSHCFHKMPPPPFLSDDQFINR